MQVFMPYADYQKSLESLDTKRLVNYPRLKSVGLLRGTESAEQ